MLKKGKAIFVEDMAKKNGEIFSAFIKLDANGNPSYTRYNPDSPEGNREILIPKEIGGVKLTHKDKETLRTGKPIYLYDMINGKGEVFSSFVKVDTETGRMSYSKTESGFEEKPTFKVPAEAWGHVFTTTEKSQLQDGKAVHITGMKGFNGQEFSSWLKVNERMGQLDYFTENPDKPRQSAGRSESAATAKEGKTIITDASRYSAYNAVAIYCACCVAIGCASANMTCYAAYRAAA